MTPLATRLRELLAVPKPRRKDALIAWNARGLIVGREDCEAVLRLLDTAKATEAVGFNKGHRRLMEAVAALEAPCP